MVEDKGQDQDRMLEKYVSDSYGPVADSIRQTELYSYYDKIINPPGHLKDDDAILDLRRDVLKLSKELMLSREEQQRLAAMMQAMEDSGIQPFD